ncbi:putative ribonuclease H-like domain-containing protein, partial [Tanacetum coccineum]
YVVPTGRVVVPTRRYVVPAGKVIIIVSSGRLSLVPTGRILSPGSDMIAMMLVFSLVKPSFHQNNETFNLNTITAVSNNNAKFPYLKKESMRVIILPPTTADEHIAVQRESKARTTLLQSIPDDHVADFHYMDDARDIWNAVKARFGGNAKSKKMRKSMLKQEFSEFRISEAEGLHKGYDRMQKILSQLNQLKAKPEDEDINLKFLRALPSSWSQVALTLKTKGGLEFLSFDDLYYKLKTLETVPSNSKTGSQRSGNVIEDVLQSFVADTEPEQQLAYEDFDQIEKLDLEEMDLKWQMAMLSVRVHKFEQKAGRKIDLEFGMIAGCDTEDEIEEGAAKIYNLITGADTKEVSTAGDAGEFALMGVTSENKVGLGFTNYIGENELGWDDSAFSVFTTNSEEVEGRPHFNSDKSTEVNSNDFASSDSSVKSSEPKSNDSISCASTSSVSTSESEAEIESNVGTPIQETIIVQIYLYVPHAILLRTRKSKITPARPQSVPTGKPKVPTPVPTENYYTNAEVMDIDSGCSRSTTGLLGKGDIRTPTLDFENVYYVKELQQFNLFSISQICDKKNRVLFTDTDCLVLSKDFKLPDDSMVLLRVPRKHNLYTINLNNLSPKGNLACLVAKASVDESVKWHRRMGHVNYKNMNRTSLVLHQVEALTTILLHCDPECTIFDGKADEGYIVGYSASNKATGWFLGHEWYTNARIQIEYDEQVIIIPSYPSHSIQEAVPKDISSDEVDDTPLDSAEEIFQKELARLKGQEQRATSVAKDTEEFQTRASTKSVPPGCIPVPTGSIQIPSGDTTISPGSVPVPTGCPMIHSLTLSYKSFPSPSDLGNNEPSLGIFSSSSYDDEFGADLNNLASTVEVSPMVTKRINTIHPQSLIIGDHTSAVQTRSKEEMQQFKFQNVWVLVDLPEAQGHRHEEGIDYDEVFSIRLFLAFASYLGFMVYQMDVKSAFLYGRIDEEVYVTQPKGFVDLQHPKKVYKHKSDIILVQVYVDDIIFGSTKKVWCDEFEALMKGEFEMSAMGELTFFLGLQVQQRPDGIFISQNKYVKDILQKFDLENVRTATTPYEVSKPKSKNEPDSPVNVHLYRSMIGSLMYLTASRPDIMFAVSACSRNQVTLLTSNLEAVKKIFKYLKGQSKLGLWYPRESPFELEAYSDSDYAGANKDRKSTTGGCQFLGRRLISWQCKKQTIVATSSTEAEYVAAANCCGQVLWIQNQLLDYGYNFMNTKIFIDNQSTICIVKNPVFHQRTKHIEIRHHFIRDANEKKLIQVLKIHTDDNVADLLTKAFDGPRFNHLVVNIGMLNP